MRMSAIAAIILAAGKSQRMGDFKPLLPIVGKPMILHVIQTVTAVNLSPVIVVTGFRANEIRPILQTTSAQEAYNPAFEQGGMLSSVKTGVRSLVASNANPSAFMIFLADQPGIKPQTVRSLTQHWTDHPTKVLLPTFNAKRGHPVLFDISCTTEILELNPSQTLKDVVQKHATELPVDDPGVLVDLDTKTDYEKELERLKHSN